MTISVRCGSLMTSKRHGIKVKASKRHSVDVHTVALVKNGRLIGKVMMLTRWNQIPLRCYRGSDHVVNGQTTINVGDQMPQEL